ncbi:hypothetical protein GOP47_0021006 [Adiantum capillus-veneris]|uniref:Uncharacterized protein n=1 Tax=Adiantum capillus-veneris TaxID=13818 RepID=A0A9D4UC38_ADICA|nr:hypothetical protein GOP47_0021006 [Adiantum capillus-veneris]
MALTSSLTLQKEEWTGRTACKQVCKVEKVHGACKVDQGKEAMVKRCPCRVEAGGGPWETCLVHMQARSANYTKQHMEELIGCTSQKGATPIKGRQ